MIDETVAMLRNGSIHTCEQWDARMAEVGASLEDEIRCLMACAVKVPEQAILIATVFGAWRGKQYPVTKKLSTGNFEAVCKHSMTFKVDDLVFLTARLDAARSMLVRYGSWWKVKQGYLSGSGFLLQSISCKGKTQSRTEPKQKVELLVIGREGDNNYDVTNVIPFPCSVDQIP